MCATRRTAAGDAPVGHAKSERQLVWLATGLSLCHIVVKAQLDQCGCALRGSFHASNVCLAGFDQPMIGL
jgi:hypothetical protein